MHWFLGLFFLVFSIQAENFNQLDWSENYRLPVGDNRKNLFSVSDEELLELKEKGYVHAQVYPVEITGLLIPYQPLITFLNADTTNPLKKLFYELSKEVSGFKSERELYEWMNLHPNKSENETGIFKIPYPNGKRDQFYISAGLINRHGADGLTFSCFNCHSNNLFGKVVPGLPNKRPRANEFFHKALGIVPFIPSKLFQKSVNATEAETYMFQRTKSNLTSTASLVPSVLGLDTSLSQVALSLSKRNLDEYATKSKMLEVMPRKNELKTHVADSKPLPWWNVKYKTRWLADGSIVSGNPVLTNILWNEIGRGSDLVELEKWMQENEQKINELAAAVFATEAPVWTDFFPEESIDVSKAKRGELVFIESCKKCHGEYEKAWSQTDSEHLPVTELIKTTKVKYFEKTPVKDVGTDPGRYQGMKYFSERLNSLAISKWMKTKVVPQEGYVPPPLVGIFARYPYFHNNSIPNLCALISPPDKRPTVFVQGPSLNAKTDFDFECVGYPVGNKIPLSWWKDETAIYKTAKKGLSNQGHYKMFLKETGEEKYTLAQKMDLIEFLKTL